MSEALRFANTLIERDPTDVNAWHERRPLNSSSTIMQQLKKAMTRYSNSMRMTIMP